jgi:hypothetical protein
MVVNPESGCVKLPHISGASVELRGIILPSMTDERFTARAAVLWGTIPKEARERILKNVFCAVCRGSVEIIKFTGEEQDGNLVLKGSCAKCGHAVARVVETSQVDSSGN